MKVRTRGLVVLALTAVAVLAITGLWFWGMHPTKALEQGEVTQVLLATNRPYQSLWETGYRPGDCVQIEQMDQAYTCLLTGASLERATSAVAQYGHSYYVPGEEPVPDPVHTISFKMADGTHYLLAVKSLAEADRGIFYGFQSAGEPVSSDQIHWFRYTNPALGQALTKMRESR